MGNTPQVVDTETGYQYEKDHRALYEGDFEFSENIPGANTTIFRLKYPVSLAHRWAFTGPPKTHEPGTERFVPRAAGKLRTLGGALIEDGRLAVSVLDRNGLERFRLFDIALKLFHAADRDIPLRSRYDSAGPTDGPSVLTYAVPEISFAEPGDSIVGNLETDAVFSLSNAKLYFEFIRLKRV